MQYEVGAKVYYMNDKGEWLPGVIHGVRTVEKPKKGTPGLVLPRSSYLVDTGKDNHIDRIVGDRKSRELGIRYNKILVEASENSPEDIDTETKRAAITRELIRKDPSLLKTDLHETVVRQPEQVEVTADFLKPR